MARRRGARVRTLLVAVALVAAACGNSGSDESDPSDAERRRHRHRPPCGHGGVRARHERTGRRPGRERHRDPLPVDLDHHVQPARHRHRQRLQRRHRGLLRLAQQRGRHLRPRPRARHGRRPARQQRGPGRGAGGVDDAFGAFVATLLFTGAPVLDEGGVPTFGWGIHAEFSGRRNLFGHNAPICARLHAADVAVPGGPGGRLEGRRARLQHVRRVEAVRRGPARLVRAVRRRRRRQCRSSSTTTTCRSACPAASGRRWRT